VKIPISWIREFVNVPSDISLSTLESAFVNVGFEVEEIVVTGSDLSGPLVVAKVESIEELSGNKKPIRYVGLDCGEAQIRFVICGATNFVVGDLVVAALPGAVLPGNFAISARETYGKTSNGMICSSRELGLSDEHAGIIVLPGDCAKPGTDAISLLEINDQKIVIIASVDFSHHTDKQTAELNDKKSLQVITNFDLERLYSLNIDSPNTIYVLLKYLDNNIL
jgi:phenylalanyl-tRNA synthetase beta chain